MTQTVKTKPYRKGPNSKKALDILRNVKKRGAEPQFQHATDEEIIRAVKQTRDRIWREKLASCS